MSLWTKLKSLIRKPEPTKVVNWPDWEGILTTNPTLWEEAKQKATTDVLIATSVGGLLPMSLPESLLAVALTLRGAKVHILLCDEFLPACLNLQKIDIPETVIENYQLKTVKCKDCYQAGRKFYEPLGLQIHRYSELVSETEKEKAKAIAQTIPLTEIPAYCLNNWQIGEHAYAGALRYFASGNLENEPHSEVIVRRYFEGAILTAQATNNLLQQHQFEVACFNHGIYLPHGIIGEVCRQPHGDIQPVRVVNWNVAYRKKCFIFSHGDTYHQTMLSEPVETWSDLPWNETMEAQIIAYLRSRWSGSRDWIWFHEKPDAEIEKIAQEIGLDLTKPIIGLLTNVMWDAQLHYRANAFPNMLSWVLATIKYFSQRQDLQLLIRIHPAEIRGTLPSRQPLLPEINKVWSQLPPNVFIIPPESPVSTYAAMLQCDSVIIYGTKTGVELTSFGIPVIVGGEAWIKGKGITLDPPTPEAYFTTLDTLPLKQKLTSETLMRARKYAYHFFFRRMIPIKLMQPVPGKPPYRINVANLDQLLPSVDPGLDVICEGILTESPFIYPAEKLGIDD
ncbi:MAG: capsule biosynthesis protein [Gloeocapsa sp. DLM2.Bin57]|nr:MAG: capsule biosynthesis protein [Gloeocapsa sp. DLM2.Bin57]